MPFISNIILVLVIIYLFDKELVLILIFIWESHLIYFSLSMKPGIYHPLHSLRLLSGCHPS